MSQQGNKPDASVGRGRWTLILGGARSGKSSRGERMALERGGRDVLFVATAEAGDVEMRDRIRRHQADRSGYGWRTVEAPRHAADSLRAAMTGNEKVVLLDCLTLLASNAVCALPEEASEDQAVRLVLDEVKGLMALMRSQKADWIIISNEVGLGLVPPYKLGRLFRDSLGRANQLLATEADEVLFMAAGLAMTLKG